MKKNSVTFLMIAVGYLIVSGITAWAAAPIVGLKDSEPGLEVLFTLNNVPGDWGKLNWATDPTTYLIVDGIWHNTATTENATLRYRTTLKFDPTDTAMPVNKDWALKLVWKHEGTTFTAGSNLIELMALDGTVTKDVAKIMYEDSTNFSLMAGDGTGAYARIVLLNKIKPYDEDVFNMASNVYHTLVFHYKAANQRMDFWFNDVLIASDFEARQAAYGLYWIQLRHGVQASIDYFDEVVIGPALDPNNPLSCEDAKMLGYSMKGDINSDCYVDMKDFAEIANDWLKCFDPINVNCEHLWVN